MKHQSDYAIATQKSGDVNSNEVNHLNITIGAGNTLAVPSPGIRMGLNNPYTTYTPSMFFEKPKINKSVIS